MNRSFTFSLYFFLGIFIIFLDQLTKKWALCVNSWSITSWFAIETSFNQGISWGFFNNSGAYIFWIITLFNILLVAGLGIYLGDQWRQRKMILGEVLIIAGGLSNLIDRFYYGAVVDFLLFFYNNYSFPVFNGADSAIVLGAVILLYKEFYQ